LETRKEKEGYGATKCQDLTYLKKYLLNEDMTSALSMGVGNPGTT
jgi:hypothetical protein